MATCACYIGLYLLVATFYSLSLQMLPASNHGEESPFLRHNLLRSSLPKPELEVGDLTGQKDSKYDAYGGSCPRGTYRSEETASTTIVALNCLPCSHCGPGLYVAHPCHRSKDTVCDSCHTYRGPHNRDFRRRCITGQSENETQVGQNEPVQLLLPTVDQSSAQPFYSMPPVKIEESGSTEKLFSAYGDGTSEEVDAIDCTNNCTFETNTTQIEDASSAHDLSSAPPSTYSWPYMLLTVFMLLVTFGYAAIISYYRLVPVSGFPLWMPIYVYTEIKKVEDV